MPSLVGWLLCSVSIFKLHEPFAEFVTSGVNLSPNVFQNAKVVIVHLSSFLSFPVLCGQSTSAIARHPFLRRSGGLRVAAAQGRNRFQGRKRCDAAERRACGRPFQVQVM